MYIFFISGVHSAKLCDFWVMAKKGMADTKAFSRNSKLYETGFCGFLMRRPLPKMARSTHPR